MVLAGMATESQNLKAEARLLEQVASEGPHLRVEFYEALEDKAIAERDALLPGLVEALLAFRQAEVAVIASGKPRSTYFDGCEYTADEVSKQVAEAEAEIRELATQERSLRELDAVDQVRDSLNDAAAKVASTAGVR
ncbi:MAG: hypothetical protein JST54_12655 [Deltaproteobacteria bacterium]|nr:hypothetical protein [Deltaproteobacteria bacterium]